MCSLITYCTVQVLSVDIFYRMPRTNGILWVSLVYQSVHPFSPVKPGSGSRPWRHLLAMLWVWKYSQLGPWPGRGEGSRTSEEIESSACGKTELHEIQHIHMKNNADIFVIVHSEYSHLWSSEMCIFKLWDSECPILTWSRVANILLIASLRQNMSVQLSVALTFGRAGQSFFCWKGCVSRLCVRTQASALVDSHLPTNRSNEGCVQAVPISPRVNCNDSAWFGQLFHDPASRTCWSAPTKGLLCWPTAPACHTLLESWTITPFLVRHVSGGSSPCRSNASVWLSERYRTVQVSIMSPPVTMQSLSLSCKSFENPAELEVLQRLT